MTSTRMTRITTRHMARRKTLFICKTKTRTETPFAKRDPNEPFPATKEALAKRDPNEPFPATKANGGRIGRPENKRAHTDGHIVSLDDEENKWIHRDKLAKIESEELQAAGIILPKPRSQSRPRRDRSTDKANGSKRTTDASDHHPVSRSRKNSTQTSGAAEKTSDPDQGGSWDCRRPDEIAEDPNEYWITSESLGPKGSRIPVAKVSPAPIPLDYLERDAPVPRKMSGTLALPDDDFSLTNLKPRSRSNSLVLDEVTKLSSAQQRSTSDNSPKKAPVPKKTIPAAARSASANRTNNTRPKTRSGTGRDKNSTARPGTRSGELSPVAKSPEGEPPWMVSAYKPDPRLPPDQQLLPTVARRLQQEQWEKEGKFGNTYDKEFRPLNEQEHLRPRETQKTQQQPETEPEPEERADEWPLRAGEGRAEAKSPTPSRPGTSSYSTMPRLNSKSSQHPPISSPRSPSIPQQNRMSAAPSQITRVPTQPEQPPVQEKEEAKKEGGCGCCVIM
ncbi:hypothetical protein PG997_014335 [Apiospora hydei]|uniref:TeaA receptor TeaR n=1 Tax=Apiospora hydei TaxID=1337664 RepID=A0ABR1UWQ3_9PEZI